MAPVSTGRISEDWIINLLRKRFVRGSGDIRKGIGDDAAVIRPAGARENWILSTDMLVEGVDFQCDWISAAQLGHKSIAVNLSDLAAMGAKPRFYLVALGLPSGTTEHWIRSFYSGMTRLGDAHGILLIGGDLSRSPAGIQISITVVGESLHKKTVYRSGGRAGDSVYVTGTLGKAAAGLRLLQRGQKKGNTTAEREALAAQRTPAPLCSEGVWLAQSGFVRCMMDLSDGLSMDLPRLCKESGTGADIYPSQLPVFRGAATLGFDPLDLALHGGEDFGLLFSVSPHKTQSLEAAYPESYASIRKIGLLTESPSIRLKPRPGKAGRILARKGFDHFKSCP